MKNKYGSSWRSKISSVQENLRDPVKSLVKNVYDLSKSFEEKLHGKNTSKGNATLKKLIINSLDEEQIWQQLEIQNSYKNTEFLRQTSVILNANEKQKSITFPFKFQDEEDEDVEEEESEEDEGKEDTRDSEKEDDFHDLKEEEEEEESDDGDENESKPTEEELKGIDNSGSIVDDKFFKLNELDKYLEAEDRKEMKRNKGGEDSDEDDEELIDYFEDDESEEEDEDDEGIKFNDFFRNPGEKFDEKYKSKQKKKLRFENFEDEEDIDENEIEEFDEEEEQEEEDNIEDSEDNDFGNTKPTSKELKSSLELRQERLKKKIESLEEDLVSEKPWQMKGEVSAMKRPQNSLLEEVVEFDLTTRPAPEITEETTLKLEDIIRQRIKDKAWDDVERKIKPVDTPQESIGCNKFFNLDLGTDHTKEYLKQAESTTANPLDEKPEEVPLDDKISTDHTKVIQKRRPGSLGVPYTPKMVLPEIRIVNNTPAIEMEEVAPVTSTDATLLAPEEVKSKHKGELMSKEERTDTDKKRERRKKKIKQKVKQKARQDKDKLSDLLQPGMGKKFNKEKMKKTLESVTKSRNVKKMVDAGDTKAVKSSTAFFNQLQDEVKATIKRKTSGETKKKSEHSAKKLKL
ncbi:U3 small nucleolar ribonucleoprotein protein MPP10-like [Diaphorina citri]|uniref:U3 small nucleolar ribonucleoprotein protein MPP10 n=1 Tax=Diaphorina citri TaxID=121845 RepID=A0A3Q0J077_DIACI|nr:U3 small nucleolar ribonucleoprotein protein MPP10-like [Diaphorina citri]